METKKLILFSFKRYSMVNKLYNPLDSEQQQILIALLKKRFEKNIKRHIGLSWEKVQSKLEAQPHKLWSLYQMELSGGEPDLVEVDEEKDEYLFYDCSIESPKGRRSLCYDREALDSRKEFKPENSALDVAQEMGIEILDEAAYRRLQELGNFDNKTSSWIATPAEIRKLGGAVFADFRYNTVFVYHNGASSYYAARGFRGSLCV